MARLKKHSYFDMIFPYIKIIFGSILYGIGFQYFIFQNNMPVGGLSGIAMITNRLWGLPVGIQTIVMNIPMFIVAWRHFGRNFLILSFAGMMCSSLAMDFFAQFPMIITSDLLLSSVYGGIIKGLGLGIICSTGGTIGGMDIGAKLLRKKFPHVNLGTMMLILEAVIISLYALIFRDFEIAMFAIIGTFVSSKVVDFVLYGAINSALCYIITDSSQAVKNAIHDQLNRTSTGLQGRGGFTGAEKEVILCALKPQQVVPLKKIIREIDPNAFVIVTDAHEVLGFGFGSIHNDN